MEDFEYLSLEPPYRAANSLLSDVSEAALFLDSKTFRMLKPYLVSLPSPSSFLNVNTMGAPIIQMLNNELTLEAAESIVIFRDSEEGFDTLEEFLQTPQLAGLSIPRELLSVKSSFYEIRIIARYREQFSYLRSILYRNSSDGSSLILKRDFSKMFDSFLRHFVTIKSSIWTSSNSIKFFSDFIKFFYRIKTTGTFFWKNKFF